MKNKAHLFYAYPIIFLLSLALHACGGGSDGGGLPASASVAKGSFIDAPVKGLAYQSGSQSGLTDVNGGFSYEIGKSVTFSIGGIVIGTVQGAKFITPVQLIPGATDEKNPSVTNIVQFLLSIDDDRDPTNGIQIISAVRTAARNATINFNLANFETDSNVTSVVDTLASETASLNQGLFDRAASEAHLKGSLSTLLAGNYAGTFSGTSSGTWTVSISSKGSVKGTFTPANSKPATLAGSISTSGLFTTTNSILSGAVDISASEISGKWILSTTNSGTFTGKKIPPIFKSQ